MNAQRKGRERFLRRRNYTECCAGSVWPDDGEAGMGRMRTGSGPSRSVLVVGFLVATMLAVLAPSAAILGRPAGSADAATATSAATSAYESAVLVDTPVGYWRLGEPAGTTTAADSSGRGLNGAYSGGVTTG